MSSAAAHDCPMTAECPAYDRDGRMCLVHPGDCDFAPADGASGDVDPSDSSTQEAQRAGSRAVEG